VGRKKEANRLSDSEHYIGGNRRGGNFGKSLENGSIRRGMEIGKGEDGKKTWGRRGNNLVKTITGSLYRRNHHSIWPSGEERKLGKPSRGGRHPRGANAKKPQGQGNPF